MVPFTAAAAIVPSLLLIWYFHSRDANPEPARVVWKTFGLGALTAIPVLVVALPVEALTKDLADPYVRALNEAFWSASIPEEFFKFLVVVLYCYRHPEFDEPMDGIVYGVLASLGFATLENVLYVSTGGLVVAVMRALTAVPMHASTGAIMGYYIGQARFDPSRRGRLFLASYTIPMVLHGAYDFPLMALKNLQASVQGATTTQTSFEEPVALVLVTLLVLAIECIWAIRLTRRVRQTQLQQAWRHPLPFQPFPTGAPGPMPPTNSAALVLYILLLLFAAFLITVGGLLTLLAVIAGWLQSHPVDLMYTHTSKVQGDDWSMFCAGFSGLLMIAIGVPLFAFGLRRIHRPASPVTFVPPSTPMQR